MSPPMTAIAWVSASTSSESSCASSGGRSMISMPRSRATRLISGESVETQMRSTLRARLAAVIG